MYESTRRGERRHRKVSPCVAPEDAAPYMAVGGRVTGEIGLAEAVAQLAAAVDALAGVDVSVEADDTLLDAVVGLQTQANRLAGARLHAVDHVDIRGAYGSVGAVTAASWLRGRTRCNPWQAANQVEAARRLRDLPELRDSLQAGKVSFAHVVEVTRAAIPARLPAIQAAEAALVELAEQAQPRDVRRAVRHVRDLADPDGTDTRPLCDKGRDERRHAWLHRTIDGLWELRALLDDLDGEGLATAIDAMTCPAAVEADDTRTPAQRSADALGDLARAWLDRGDGPTRHGAKPHLLGTIDLTQLLTPAAQDAVRSGRLGFGGDIDPGVLRRFLTEADPKLTVVLTLGPWRVVNVGRTHRNLPSWLRAILQTVHQHCRGPDCDRPAIWGHAHHIHGWADGGETDLNGSIPLCPAHHDLITTGGWTATLDLDTGIVTWTSPTGRIIHVHPTR